MVKIYLQHKRKQINKEPTNTQQWQIHQTKTPRFTAQHQNVTRVEFQLKENSCHTKHASVFQNYRMSQN